MSAPPAKLPPVSTRPPLPPFGAPCCGGGADLLSPPSNAARATSSQVVPRPAPPVVWHGASLDEAAGAFYAPGISCSPGRRAPRAAIAADEESCSTSMPLRGFQPGRGAGGARSLRGEDCSLGGTDRRRVRSAVRRRVVARCGRRRPTAPAGRPVVGPPQRRIAPFRRALLRGWQRLYAPISHRWALPPNRPLAVPRPLPHRVATWARSRASPASPGGALELDGATAAPARRASGHTLRLAGGHKLRRLGREGPPPPPAGGDAGAVDWDEG